MSKVLMKGNEAIALAAIKGGCNAYFGYPITPQNEIPEYLSKHMIERGLVFVQAESEVSAINMVYGAAGAGSHVMTTSSSPGIALMQEGISYLCGAELPCVLVNVMRGGPGLGGIQPSQSDYNQITRGGGNGDYNVLAYAPENLQETVDILKQAFSIADYYRNPVMIAADGLIGQMMESVDLDHEVELRKTEAKTWATTGSGKRSVVTSLYLDPNDLYNLNLHLNKKYQEMKENEQRYELVGCKDAQVVIVAYGTMARISRSVIEDLNKEGIKVGLLRPITIWPFPEKAFDFIPKDATILCAELSMGQMIDDVKIAVNGRNKIEFIGRAGGIVPEPDEISDVIREIVGGKK